MYDNEKIYSIELGEDLEIQPPVKEPRAVAAVPTGAARPRRTASKAAPRPQATGESKPPSGGLQFASLLALTYLLGPFSVHLNPANRGRKRLLTIGMISGTAGLGMFAGWGFILDLIGKGWPLWPWAVIGMMVLMTAFSVWARSAYLAGSRDRPGLHGLPSPLRKPWAVGIVGLVAPGLGLLLAGCARRGASVIWAGWPVVAAGMVLANGLRIWSRNLGAGAVSVPPVHLEIVFLLSAVILVAGLIGWIAQALEGARQMMGEPGIRHRMRGDWYAAALLCTMLGMAVIWDPTTVARNLDNGSIVLREKGLKLIPLQLTRGAYSLDPGPSEYAVRVIELSEELGRRDEAARLRQELDGNLASYLALVHAENRGGVVLANTGRTPVKEWKVLADLFGQTDSYVTDRPAY